MAFCVNCGTKIEEGVKFCLSCGAQADSAGGEARQDQAVNAVQVQPAAALSADEKFCFSCGSVIKKAAGMCPRCGVNQNNRNTTAAVDVYCMSCGKTIKKDAAVCPFCGVNQGNAEGYPPGYVPKNWTTALILCILLGLVGGHRFYVGKVGTGILMILVCLCTFGIGGLIWWIVDLIILCTGKFTDKQGYLLQKN